MAQRFGGTYSRNSPGTPAATAPKPKAMIRAGLMFFLPLPLVFTAYFALRGENLAAAVTDLAAFVLFIFAAWLLRDGLKAEAAFNARTRASRPALPRKILAALLCGGGAILASLSAGPVFAIGLGPLVAALHLVAFGIDPMRGKGLEGTENIDARRAAKVVADADLDVVAITAIAEKSRDIEISDSLRRFLGSVTAMLRNIEEDPRDLVQSRKFLSVYLKGAREAAEKYQALIRKGPAPEAKAALVALFDDLAASFTAERAEMLLDDKADLDVEISVLKDRLASERRAQGGDEA